MARTVGRQQESPDISVDVKDEADDEAEAAQNDRKAGGEVDAESACRRLDKTADKRWAEEYVYKSAGGAKAQTKGREEIRASTSSSRKAKRKIHLATAGYAVQTSQRRESLRQTARVRLIRRRVGTMARKASVVE